MRLRRRPVRALIEHVRPKEIWIAASTTASAREGDLDEDDAVIAAFRELAPAHPQLLLILVPRKPERFHVAAERLAQAGLPFLRRSTLATGEDLPLPGVLLLDSIGELSSLFSLADVVFMGGSLADRGGHNILEPALFGRSIITGPHMENFREIARKFTEAGALVRITGDTELAEAVERLLASPDRRTQIGEEARRLAENERGAGDRISAVIAEQYWQAIPHNVPALPLHIFLWLLSKAWLAGARIDRHFSRARARKLDTPAISVGGLAVGGVGKTPFVLWLAQALKRRGIVPAILTRGYRRTSKERVLIFAAGETAPPERTGDEAQFYLASGVGPVGIGADRYAAGRRLEARFRPGVFLLDDAFQHHRLERDVDIVLLDALDPFAGGAPLPLGRLREPLGALGRADIIVLTRVQPSQKTEAIEAVVRRYNPDAPIFTTRIQPAGWVDAATAEPAVPPAKTAAFCGLGNPAAFWRSIKELGLDPLRREAFTDHHKYSREELKSLAVTGADALLTTEKDVMNLPMGWQQAIAPTRVLWLRIEVCVARGEEMLGAIQERLAHARHYL